MGVCEDIENASCFSKTGFEGLYTTLFFDNENVRNLDSFAVGSVGIDSYWIFCFRFKIDCDQAGGHELNGKLGSVDIFSR